jgi:hypothetical protein
MALPAGTTMIASVEMFSHKIRYINVEPNTLFSAVGEKTVRRRHENEAVSGNSYGAHNKYGDLRTI